MSEINLFIAEIMHKIKAILITLNIKQINFIILKKNLFFKEICMKKERNLIKLEI